jgi:urease accessory protein
MSVPVQRPPWRVIRAFQNAERQAVVHLHNVSGGILAADSLTLLVEAGINSRVQMTTVGATRIYRNRAACHAAQSATWIRVGDGAMVEYLPDAVIPFAGSRFRQSMTVWLGSDAGFIGWETIAAGRVARGEEFEFDVFDSEYGVYSEARPLVLERFSLSPSVRDPRSAARWGRFRYTASLYIFHTGVAQKQWLELESRLNELAFGQSSADARWGVSALIAGGMVIRGMAIKARHITAGLHGFWEISKHEIRGERAIAPRKIN